MPQVWEIHPALRYGGHANGRTLPAVAADKLVMENMAVVVNRWVQERNSSLPADLLEAMQRMVRGGHLPSSLLLVQLTDGRVRLDAAPGNLGEAKDRLGQMGNEYGPARAAFWISVERAGPEVRLAVETLCGSPGNVAASVCVDHACGATPGRTWSPYLLATGDGSASCSTRSPASSKKRAMREASFGITTG